MMSQIHDPEPQTAPQSASRAPASPADRALDFATGLWLITSLELRQRVRGVGWYVLLGIFILLVAVVTVLLWLSTSASEHWSRPH